MARILQGVGYGFFFVPANLIAYSMLRPDQNNKASSLTNLFRNWGGSFGIALITTVSERRSNFHQVVVGTALTPSSPYLHASIATLTAYLRINGFSPTDAVGGAYALLYQNLLRQVTFLAFIDCFRVLCWITLAAVPLMLLVQKTQLSRTVPEGAH